MNNFSELKEREVLALAIPLEEEDERTYDNYAHYLQQNYPQTAEVFRAMSKEESGHRRRLIDLYRKRFGEFIPMIRRSDVHGMMKRPSVWLGQPFGRDKVREQVEAMEMESLRFYRKAASQTNDASLRQLFNDLAAEERRHESKAESLVDRHLTPSARGNEDETQRKLFVLQIVQPGLAGLMDGSVSTLAPIFAAAFATHQSHDAFLVGLAASVGAGISMAFAEAASDDGSLTGRGSPVLRAALLQCEVLQRIDGAIVLTHLEMQVRPGRAPGRADRGNDVAGRDDLTDAREDLAAMRVARRQAVSVVDRNEIAVAPVAPDRDDASRHRRLDRAPFICRNVETGMKLRSWTERILPLAEAGGDLAPHGQLHRRRCGRLFRAHTQRFHQGICQIARKWKGVRRDDRHLRGRCARIHRSIANRRDACLHCSKIRTNVHS